MSCILARSDEYLCERQGGGRRSDGVCRRRARPPARPAPVGDVWRPRWVRSGRSRGALPALEPYLGCAGACRSMSIGSRSSTPCSWRRPTRLSAEVGPALAARGPKVFDLSGAFRLRDRALRQRWYPHSPDAAVPVTYGLTERYRDELERRAADRLRGLLPDGRDPVAAAARRGGSARAGHHHRREVRRLRRGKNADASARTSPRFTAAWPRTAYSRTAMAPRSNRKSACR